MIKFLILLVLLFALPLAASAQKLDTEQCYRLALTNEWSQLVTIGVTENETVPLLPADQPVSTFAVDPTGTRIAYGSTTFGEYFLYNGSTTIQLDMTYGTFRWSPDGSRLVAETVDAANVLRIEWIDPQTGAHTPIADGQAARWSPDGSRIAFFSPDGLSVTLLDVATGDQRTIALPMPANSYELAWSPDGTQIAYNGRAGSEQPIGLIDVAGGEVRLIPGVVAVGVVAWAPDGSGILILGGTDYHLDLHLSFVLPNGSERRLTEPNGIGVGVYSTGFPLLYMVEEQLFLLSDLNAQPQVVHTNPLTMSLIGTPSPDGRYLFYTLIDDNRLRLLDMQTGEERVLELSLPVMTTVMWVGC